MTANTSPLAGYASQIRSQLPKGGEVISQALLAIDDALAVTLFTQRSVSGFSLDQLSNTSIDTLYIRNPYLRQRLSDPTPIQNISVVGSVIYPLGEWIRLKNTAVGALTLTSAPTIPDGKNGQVIELLNISANNIVVQDQGTLAGSNLRLSANTITLGTRDSLIFRYSSDIGDWVQTGFTNVL